MLKIIILVIIIVFAVLIIKGNREDKARMREEAEILIKKEQEIAEERERQVEERKRQVIENGLEKSKHDISCLERFDIKIDKNNILTRKALRDMPEIKFKNITRSFNKNSLPTFVVVDVETTGLYAYKDRIIELSAIFYENYESISCFTTLINPQKPIPEDASDINGIYDEDVEDAPTIAEVSNSFLEFVGNCPVVAYNASFDLKFLYCSGIDLISAKNPLYDAYALARKAYRDQYSYKLPAVANSIGIYYNAHSSLDDCYATGKVFEDAIDEIIYS